MEIRKPFSNRDRNRVIPRSYVTLNYERKIGINIPMPMLSKKPPRNPSAINKIICFLYFPKSLSKSEYAYFQRFQNFICFLTNIPLSVRKTCRQAYREVFHATVADSAYLALDFSNTHQLRKKVHQNYL